jgi:hypothetical protein
MKEELILLACEEIVELIFGPVATEEIINLPLSNNTVDRRIVKMSKNIKHNINKILHIAEKFSFQLGETTDMSGKSQLIFFTRFVVETQTIHQLLFCWELDMMTIATTTTGSVIFDTVSCYSRDNLFGTTAYQAALMV